MPQRGFDVMQECAIRSIRAKRRPFPPRLRPCAVFVRYTPYKRNARRHPQTQAIFNAPLCFYNFLLFLLKSSDIFAYPILFLKSLCGFIAVKWLRLRDGQALPAVSRKDKTVTFLLLLQPRRLELSFTAVIYLRCLLPSLFSADVYYRRFISIVLCRSHFPAPSRAWRILFFFRALCVGFLFCGKKKRPAGRVYCVNAAFATDFSMRCRGGLRSFFPLPLPRQRSCPSRR